MKLKYDIEHDTTENMIVITTHPSNDTETETLENNDTNNNDSQSPDLLLMVPEIIDNLIIYANDLHLNIQNKVCTHHSLVLIQ